MAGITGKIKRQLMAHYINTTPTVETAAYERIGKDLEEYNVEMNANVETKNNIIGQTSVVLDSYQPSADADPYYAEAGTGLFTLLQDIIDNRKVLDDTKTDAVEVHLWDGTAGAYVAYKEEVYLEAKSYGGNYEGYQIPFTVHYTGNRTKGTWDEATKKFTAATA